MATIADLNSEARALTDSDTTSYPAADLLRRINQAYEETVSLILNADGRWQFDDTNFTTFPIATTTLVAAQKDYAFDTAHLEIERVEIKDSGGIWQLLEPIDNSQIGTAVDEAFKTDGLPLYYDKKGKSLILYPGPAEGSVTLAAGLKVYFKRTADIFTAAQVTTGTKVPGFVSTYHYILSYKAALPYAMAYKRSRVPLILAEIARMERGLKEHYGRREQDRRKRLEPAGISFR